MNAMYKLATQIVVPNDKLNKVFFSLTFEEFIGIMNEGRQLDIDERPKKKKGKPSITTFIKLQLQGNLSADDFVICSTPLDAFDRAVFCAAASERLAGNSTTSLSAIYRLVHGQSAGGNYRLKDKQAKEIFSSLKKLSSLLIFADLTEICKLYKCEPLKINFKPILPCRIYEGKLLGGNSTTLIDFTDEPPLLTIAKLKNNQLLSFDSNLLTDASDFSRFNRRTIAARFYTLIRVLEIKLHSLTPIITVDDVFEKCRIDFNIRHERKAHCLDAIIFLLEHLKNEDVIHSFKLQKDTLKNKLFNSIKIAY